jgi:hypothetical protein
MRNCRPRPPTVSSVAASAFVERALEDAARAHEGVDAGRGRGARASPPGSSGARWSSVSGSRTRGSIVQSTLSSAPWQLKPAPNDDSHHQPPARRRRAPRRARSRRTRSTGCRTRAASPRCSGTPAVAELEALLEREQHVAAAGMHDPRGDVARHEAGAHEHRLEHALGVLGGERGHLAGQDVAQHAVALLEHQRLALGGLDQRGAVDPFDATLRRRVAGLAREDRGAGAVAEQARADQHAGVVVEVHRGAADLDADREHVRRGAERSRRGRAAGWAARQRSPGRRGRTPARRRAGRAARRRSPKAPGRGSRCRC